MLVVQTQLNYGEQTSARLFWRKAFREGFHEAVQAVERSPCPQPVCPHLPSSPRCMTPDGAGRLGLLGWAHRLGASTARSPSHHSGPHVEGERAGRGVLVRICFMGPSRLLLSDSMWLSGMCPQADVSLFLRFPTTPALTTLG